MQFPISRVKNGWSADLHVHNHWSLDIPSGPKASEYLEIAEKNKIHIGFLDHYELFYLSNPTCPYKDKEWIPTWPFDEQGWSDYLEEMDSLRSSYPFVSTGLEIDYYADMEPELRNFVEAYGDEFDFLVGSMHELEHWRPVTLPTDLIALVNQMGGFENAVTKYFDLQERMIKTKIFKAVAHIDTIFRYCRELVPMKDEYDRFERTKKIIELCIETGTWIEYNLSGWRFPINRPFPAEPFLHEYIPKGAHFYVGSDSHSVADFAEYVPKVQTATKLLNILYK